MAPKRKTPSSKSAPKGAPKKKVKTQKTVPAVDPLEEKVEAIKDAIVQYEEDPAIQTLLTAAATHAFETPVDKRHKFYTEYIGMIDLTIQKYVRKFDEDVNKKVAETATASSKKEEKSLHRSQLADLMEKKNDEISQKQVDLSAKEESLKATGKQLKAKRAEKMKVCGPLTQLENQLDDANEKFSCFVKLKDEAASCSEKDRKKLVQVLMPYLKIMKVEGSLAQAAPAALGSESRDGFNSTVIDNISAEFEKHRNGLKKNIELEGEQHKGIISDVLDAESATNLAKEAVERTREELQVLERDRTEFSQKQKEADKEIKAHDKFMKILDEDLKKTSDNFNKVQKVYQDMVEIRDRVSDAPGQTNGFYDDVKASISDEED